MSAGLAESPIAESGPKPDMLFQGEGTRVCVVILECALWADRRAFMDSVMRASAFAGKASRTYLALPKMAASLADARLFQDLGIGLFTYDQRNIDEALPARYFETTTATPHQVDNARTDQLRNEIHEIRAKFDVLERTVQQLSQELASWREMRSPGQSMQTFTRAEPLRNMPAVDNLPTFFAGNPWLEVLSRRGREETAIAG